MNPTTCQTFFFLIRHLKWSGICAFYFSSPASSCCTLGTVFCTDHVQGAYVPSAIARILRLLGNREQRGCWRAGGEEQAGAGRVPGRGGGCWTCTALLLVEGTMLGWLSVCLQGGHPAASCPCEMARVCADAGPSQAPAGTCWCSALPVICRNSLFGFPSLQEHQVLQLLSSHTCSSSLNLVAPLLHFFS